jgi:FKBP-type peptidyl-prolyl cis-trans isomerase FklB
MKQIIITLASIFLFAGTGWAGEQPTITGELTSERDRVSYSLGHQMGSDLRQQGKEIDPQTLLEGIRDGIADADPQISPEVMRSLLLDTKKQIVARQRSEKLEMREQRLGEGARFLEENSKRKGVVVLPNGLQYEILREGKGQKPGPTDKVIVHYEGTLIGGRVTGSSYRKGKPETFYVNGVMKGLTQAFQLMREGAKWKVFIPPDLAIGNRGELANRTLIYDLELLSVEPAE